MGKRRSGSKQRDSRGVARPRRSILGRPQRRKRIFLVGSFGSNSAEKILFKRDSVRGYLTPRREAWQKAAADIGNGVAKCDSTVSVVYDARGNGDSNTAPTITGGRNDRVTDYTAIVCSAGFIDKAPSNARGIGYEAEKSATLRAGVVPSTVYAIGNGQTENTGLHNVVGALNCMHDQQSVIYAIDRAAFNHGENAKYDFEITENGVNPTLVTKGPSAVCYGFPLGFRAENTNIYNECATTLCNGTRPGHCNAVCYNIGADQSSGMLSDNPYSGIYETDGNGGNQGGTAILQELIDWIVRRLTLRECERLQGYPDDWTVLSKISDMFDEDYMFFRDVFCTYRAINGKRVKKPPTKEQIIKRYNKLDKDSPRYRALGNSLAIPCALRVLDGIAEVWKERRE